MGYLRRLAILVALLALLALMYTAWTAVQVWQSSHVDEEHSADAIVVLGAAQYNGTPSPVLKARLDHALFLYRHHLAPVFIVTGGKQPGDRYTEAESSTRYLETRGV